MDCISSSQENLVDKLIEIVPKTSKSLALKKLKHYSYDLYQTAKDLANERDKDGDHEDNYEKSDEDSCADELDLENPFDSSSVSLKFLEIIHQLTFIFYLLN